MEGEIEEQCHKNVSILYPSMLLLEELKSSAWGVSFMAHTIRDKGKLLNRVRRIRGQIDAVEKALDQEQDCSSILQTIAACRGAINSLMAEMYRGTYSVSCRRSRPATHLRKGQGHSGAN